MYKHIILLLLLSLPVFAIDQITLLALFRDKATLEIDGTRQTLLQLIR